MPLVSVVAHLLQRHRRADHVAGELHAALCIVRAHPHLIVRRKPAAVAPAEQLRAQLVRDRALLHQELKHRAPKALGQQRFGHWRTRDERALGTEHPVGGEHMQVRIEVGQIPEGLQPLSRNASTLSCRSA